MCLLMPSKLQKKSLRSKELNGFSFNSYNLFIPHSFLNSERQFYTLQEAGQGPL